MKNLLMKAAQYAAKFLPTCTECGRIVDPREKCEGGDGFGVEFSEDGDWACSVECWDRATDTEVTP